MQPGSAQDADAENLIGLIHHDAGRQYTSIAFTERLAEIGIDPSLGLGTASWGTSSSRSNLIKRVSSRFAQLVVRLASVVVRVDRWLCGAIVTQLDTQLLIFTP